MPTFRTAPSSSLTTSIRNMIASGGSKLGPVQEMAVDEAAARTAHNVSLAEKARAEVEAMTAAQAQRNDPALRTEYAAHAAGIDLPAATRLSGAIRGAMEQPGPSDVDDAAAVGAEAQPYPMARPNLQPGQERLFRSALASTIGNLIGTGKTNAEQLAHASDRTNETALTARAAEEPDVPTANRIVAAVAGKVREPYKVGPQGQLLNEETGVLDENTALAGAVKKLRDAQAAAATASAGQRDAGGKPPVGFRWTQDGTLEPVPGGPADPLGGQPKPTADASKKTGDDFLATLPENQREQIRSVAEGRTPLTVFSIKGGHRERIHQLVMQYDPTYNATRATTWKEFTTGSTARNVTSINTAIGHMGTMYDLAEAMNNKDPRLVNSVVNRVSTALGKPEVNNFETARQAVGEELMRTFRQVGASEQEAKAWGERFSSANSPAQMKGAIKTAAELLNSRIDAVNDMWKRGGFVNDFPNLLSPKSVKTMGLVSGKAKAAPAALAPVNAKGWKLMKDAKGNQAYVGPNNEIEEVQ